MPDITTIQQLWKDRTQHRAVLELAGADNARQSFHARVSLRAEDAGPYHALFLKKVEEILGNKEKFKVFKDLMPYPLPSTEVISKASDEWNKIFYAQDRSIELHLTDEKQEGELESILDEIGLQRFIEQDVFTKAKQAVNTIGVVDAVLVEGPDGTPRTRPKLYLLDAANCTYIHESQGRITTLAYTTGSEKEDNLRLYVLDEDYYWSFQVNKEGLTLIAQNPHGLGVCPATFIWHDIIDKGASIRRFNAVIESLARLDEYVIAEVFMRHMDLYAAFPILWSYASKCMYQNPAGYMCHEGYINYIDERGNEVHSECPACQKKKAYVGPGEHLVVDVPTSQDEKPLGQPANFIQAERTLLDYNVEKTKRLKAELFRFLSGFDDNTDGKGTKQYNEEQVGSMNESRQAVLRYWAENIQMTHKFFLDIIGKLLYAEDYLGSTVNYGEDWLLADMNTAIAEYQKAKNAGLPQYIVGLKRRTVEQLHAKVSPSAALRIQILSELEPYVDVPLIAMQAGSDAYELKANFAAYIARFERENGDIVRFGRLVSFEEKIKAIKQTLDSYVSKQKQRMVWQPRQEAGVPLVGQPQP